MYPSTRYAPAVFDGLFDEFFHAATRPLRVDVRETPAAYTLLAEVPGVKKEDIHVEVERNEVTIRAESRREAEGKDGEKWLRRERAYGKAERRFALPVEVEESAAQARFTDGVLELTLPKKAQAQSRRIAVQ